MLFLEWLTNYLLVVMPSEPPWAVCGLIYMVIRYVDDTLVIISTDWSWGSSNRWFDLLWCLNFTDVHSRRRGLLKQSLVFLCSCIHKNTSLIVHDISPFTLLRLRPPLSAQQCLAEQCDYSDFYSSSHPSMPHSPWRSLISPSRPQPVPSLAWAWWRRSIGLSVGLFIQESYLDQSATDTE